MNDQLHTLLLRTPVAFGLTAALVLVASPSWAQEQRPETAARTSTAQGDHQGAVGHYGFSWYGVSTIPIGQGSPGGSGSDPAVNANGIGSVLAPVLGVRYWMSPKMGLDVGLGLAFSGGSIRSTTAGADKLPIFGAIAHLGVPLSMREGKHISLQITPEMNFGFATATVEPVLNVDPPPPASLSGMRLDVGARVGAEVHFGFIDIPELALEGSIGAYLTYQRASVTVGEAKYTDTSMLVTTSAFNSPWDFFRSTVAARYYF